MGFWHIYCGIYGGSGVEEVVILTTRLTLIGTSAERLTLAGTPGTRLTLEGASP